LAASELALGTDITSHANSWTLDAALLRRAAAVVRDRGDVRDARDLEPHAVQGADRRFTPRAGTADTHFDVLHAMLLRGPASLLGRHLRRERRGLAGAAETAAARRRPRQGVPLPIGDRDDRVVERGVNVRDCVENVLARLLRLLGAARGGCGARG